MDHIGIDVHKKERQIYILAEGGEIFEHFTSWLTLAPRCFARQLNDLVFLLLDKRIKCPEQRAGIRGSSLGTCCHRADKPPPISRRSWQSGEAVRPRRPGQRRRARSHPRDPG